jgi:hypothetical protein
MVSLIVLTSQIVFNLLKVLEIRFTYENKINHLLINTVLINSVSLISVYYSLESLLAGDFFIIFFYIGGSVLGKWLGMKFHNPRKQIWDKLFGK